MGSAARVAIIGGGISGIACAAHLAALMPAVAIDLFEASERLGGVLQTECWDDYRLELAADNYSILGGEVDRLHRALGIDVSALKPNASYRHARVVHRGKAHPIPAGFSLLQPNRLGPIFASKILSPQGKLRLAAERFIPRRTDEADESLADFATRRLGREAFERLVEPVVCGIFTAVPERLSMRAALPQFVEMERRHGGLIAAARARDRETREAAGEAAAARTASGARYDIFAAPAGGMSDWVVRLSAALPACVRVHTASPVQSLVRTNAGWSLKRLTGTADGEQLGSFDGCVIATTAPHAAKLLSEVDHRLTDDVGGVCYADSSIAAFGIPLAAIPEAIRCFGIVVPRIVGGVVLAISFTSLKYAGRCPGDEALVRVFLGGAIHPEVAGWSDREIEAAGWEAICRYTHVACDPLWARIIRWPAAMPQYELGHVDRIQRIEQRMQALGTLQMCGNAYRGVGIPQCIASGRRAAEQIAAGLQRFGN